MTEQQPSSSQLADSVPVAAPASPAAQAGEGELQPPQHWSEQPLEDDGDSALGDDAASSTASIASSILEYRTVNGRTYHSDRGSHQYWGANDDRQNETLDIHGERHHVFTLAQDGKLCYAPLKPDIQKAVDIGTGTGIWAIDFGDEYPNCEVIGTDLSPIQPGWVPPNVHFQIDDFTQEWTFADNSLDYVHFRWLVGTVTDWAALFKQAYKALKPGGWIESFECNGYFESEDDTVTDKTAAAQWGYIFREGSKKMGSTASFTVVRDGLQKKALEEAGFTNIQQQPLRFPISDWATDPKLKQIGQYTRAALENDIEGTMGFMANQLGWSPEEVTVYAAHLRKEVRQRKVHALYRANVAWAQKPETSETSYALHLKLLSLYEPNQLLPAPHCFASAYPSCEPEADSDESEGYTPAPHCFASAYPSCEPEADSDESEGYTPALSSWQRQSFISGGFIREDDYQREVKLFARSDTRQGNKVFWWDAYIVTSLHM
ncbi:uncharacterized protein E0L32_009825 [Thyridium curvatum]|uniref:Uncharacterized protein n=1 Tax=Thyridium curvatum TaxID=1093900 RepID=A0A507API4_9PEZI|nr:uncharacterized protein E0L32_009825 [Thyridium curvatum]TPX08636.1 hypothetical protein E0L32_009825 [Thyridium curvatum]